VEAKKRPLLAQKGRPLLWGTKHEDGKCAVKRIEKDLMKSGCSLDVVLLKNYAKVTGRRGDSGIRLLFSLYVPSPALR